MKRKRKKDGTPPKKKQQLQKKELLWKELLWPLVFSIVILLCSYIYTNSPLLLDADNMVSKLVSKTETTKCPDEIVFVNTAYDKVLVRCAEGSRRTEPISNRQHLADFLNSAKIANNYKYIVVDLDFSLSGKDTIDDMPETNRELVNALLSMDRVLIPMPRKNGAEVELIDPRLDSISGIASYSISSIKGDCDKIMLEKDGRKSIPVLLAEQMSGKQLKHWGIFYYSFGGLCRGNVSPVPIAQDDDNNQMEFNNGIVGSKIETVDIGLLNYPQDVADFIQDRIVFIGDFVGDMHSTYSGNEAGPTILAEAYACIMDGKIHIRWYVELILLIVYMIALYLSTKDISNIIARIIFNGISFIGFPILIKFIFSYCFGIHYDITIPTIIIGLYSLFGNILKK